MSRLQSFLQTAKILEFPGFRQNYEWSCGSTAMNMILAYFGNDVNEKEIMDIAGANPEIGTPIDGLMKVAKKYGLKFDDGHFNIGKLKEFIDNGWPTLLMIQAWTRSDNPDWKNEWDQGHYTVCIGYDDKRVYFADPISIKRVFLTYSGLNSRWHGWDDDGKKIQKWGMVFMEKSKYGYDDVEEMG